MKYLGGGGRKANGTLPKILAMKANDYNILILSMYENGKAGIMTLDRHMGKETSAVLVSKYMGRPIPGGIEETRPATNEGLGNQYFPLCSYVRHNHRMLGQYEPDMYMRTGNM